MTPRVRFTFLPSMRDCLDHYRRMGSLVRYLRMPTPTGLRRLRDHADLQESAGRLHWAVRPRGNRHEGTDTIAFSVGVSSYNDKNLFGTARRLLTLREVAAGSDPGAASGRRHGCDERLAGADRWSDAGSDVTRRYTTLPDPHGKGEGRADLTRFSMRFIARSVSSCWSSSAPMAASKSTRTSAEKLRSLSWARALM